jgi:hypothetical protein
MHSYRIAGLLVRSEVALPGAIACPNSSAHEVIIRPASVPFRFLGTDCSRNWQIQGDQLLVRVPGVARFLLTAGREIAFEPEQSTPVEDIAPYLAGGVFGALLHQRGQIALHASAVCVNGKAVLFCGPSGAGKSTLAAALGQHGYPLIADDLCALELARSPMVHPDWRHLRLSPAAIDALGLGGKRGPPVHSRFAKSFVEPDHALAVPVPIRAIYVLQDAESRTGILARARAVDAVWSLMRNGYRPFLIDRLGQRDAYFRAAAQIAHTTGVFYLARRLDFVHLPDMIDALKRHWSETDLAEAA